MTTRPRVHSARTIATRRHVPEEQRQKQLAQGEARQAKRTYRTGDSRWRRLRLAVLKAEPLCRTCAAKSKLTPAVAVDHIDNDPTNNDRSNLQSLCIPCHNRKTAIETRGRKAPWDDR